MIRIGKWLTLILVGVLALATLLPSVVKEREQRSIGTGMTRASVELILGDPIYPARTVTNALHGTVTELTYRGNPSLWYGRLEHYIKISLRDGSVVEIKRYGL